MSRRIWLLSKIAEETSKWSEDSLRDLLRIIKEAHSDDIIEWSNELRERRRVEKMNKREEMD